MQRPELGKGEAMRLSFSWQCTCLAPLGDFVNDDGFQR